jgi:HD-GYP domain-containing protein (c-di-GMP phosphodiesterase class II)
VLLAALANKWAVPFLDYGAVTLSFITTLAAATLFGPCFGALTAGGASLVIDIVNRRWSGPVKMSFNTGQLALVGGLSGLAFQLLAQPGANLAGNAPAYVAAALVFVMANSMLTSGILALLGHRFFRIWVQVLRGAGVFYLAMAPLGALLANAYLQSPWAMLYFPLLIWVIYRGFGLYVRLRTETASALVTLADSLERRDPYTRQHSVRVADYVSGVVALLGLPPEEQELIVSAAHVHDLGKISIDNRILLKEGPLTEEERLHVNTHAAAGAELAGQFSMYEAGARIIRHHHERWDGSGYPDGLAGEAIPLGSRVIAVADVYDAMTSDRPYRKALSHDVAVSELVQGAGSQFDAAIVEAFLAVQHQAEPKAEASRVRSSVLAS